MDQAEARRRVTGAAVARLATVAADGSPHLVPCCFAVDGDRWYSAVDAKPKTTAFLRRLANVTETGRASVLVDHYDDDWGALWWVRLDGPARVVRAGPELDRALGLLRAKYRQYERTGLPGPVVAVDVTRWTGWSAGG